MDGQLPGLACYTLLFFPNFLYLRFRKNAYGFGSSFHLSDCLLLISIKFGRRIRCFDIEIFLLAITEEWQARKDRRQKRETRRVGQTGSRKIVPRPSSSPAAPETTPSLLSEITHFYSFTLTGRFSARINRLPYSTLRDHSSTVSFSTPLFKRMGFHPRLDLRLTCCINAPTICNLRDFVAAPSSTLLKCSLWMSKVKYQLSKAREVRKERQHLPSLGHIASAPKDHDQ
jgi:hypothetical protein